MPIISAIKAISEIYLDVARNPDITVNPDMLFFKKKE